MVELFDDRILLIPDPAETVTDGGIIIPDSVTEFEKKKKGTVIAHGKGYVDQNTGELLPISVYVGCRVSFAAHLGEEMSATDMEIEEGKYLLINERDIDCIIEESFMGIIPMIKKYSNFIYTSDTYFHNWPTEKEKENGSQLIN